MAADAALEQNFVDTFGSDPFYWIREIIDKIPLTKPPSPNRALAKIRVPQYLEWRSRVCEERNGEVPDAVKDWDLWLMQHLSGFGDIELMKQLMDLGIPI